MSFFSKIFRKKPGGTFFGNLIRQVANEASGGLLGTGKNRVPIGETVAHWNKVHGISPMEAKTVPLITARTQVQLDKSGKQVSPSGGSFMDKAKAEIAKAWTWVKKNVLIFSLAVAAVAAAAYFFIFKTKH